MTAGHPYALRYQDAAILRSVSDSSTAVSLLRVAIVAKAAGMLAVYAVVRWSRRYERVPTDEGSPLSSPAARGGGPVFPTTPTTPPHRRGDDDGGDTSPRTPRRRASPFVQTLLSTRSSFRPLLGYVHDGWGTAIATELAAVVLEGALWLACSAGGAASSSGANIDGVFRSAGSLIPSALLAATISDAVTVAPLPAPLRALVGPILPSSASSREALARVVLPSLSRTPYGDARSAMAVARHFALAEALRTTIRTAVILARRYLSGNTYLRASGVVVQATTNGAVAGLTTFVSTTATYATLGYLGKGKGPRSFWAWAAVYSLAWTCVTALLTFGGARLNHFLQPMVRRVLYTRLPGVANSRQRLFDLAALDEQFHAFSAVELSEISQYANEALRSAAINHNTRLHAVRFLASLTAYVSAVNKGILKRAAWVPTATASIASLNATSLAAPSSSAALSRPLPPATMPVESPSPAATATPPQRPTVAAGGTTTESQPPSVTSFDSHTFTDQQISERLESGQPAFTCGKCGELFQANEVCFILPCGHLIHAQRPACSTLLSDWCPVCARPTQAPTSEERMAIFISMRRYADRLANEWEAVRILPPALDFAEWEQVAQYARRRRVVEGEVPLDVVPWDHQPGQSALLDLPIAGLLWALRVLPTDCRPLLFVASGGW